jgi:nitrite reductase/ring-hydroxylating ferredoxin subunit
MRTRDASTPTPARHRFVTGGAVSGLPPGVGRRVVVGRRHVAIFRLDEGIFAIDNLCLHQAGPLRDGDGVVEDGAVTCPWHGWSYDIRTAVLVQDGRGASPAIPLGSWATSCRYVSRSNRYILCLDRRSGL